MYIDTNIVFVSVHIITSDKVFSSGLYYHNLFITYLYWFLYSCKFVSAQTKYMGDGKFE